MKQKTHMKRRVGSERLLAEAGGIGMLTAGAVQAQRAMVESGTGVTANLFETFHGFRVTRLALGFRALDDGFLPEWLGSAWRGLLGHGLKDAICVTGLPACKPCPLIDECPYPVLFEARPPAGASMLRPSANAPGPYTLLAGPGGRVAQGDRLPLRLTLFGDHSRHAALLVKVLALGANEGLGERRLAFALDRLAMIAADGAETELGLAGLKKSPRALQPLASMPSCPEAVTIHFTTPLRLRVKNRYVAPERLCFGDFFAHLLRRCSLLLQFYQRADVDLDFRQWVDLAHGIGFTATDLGWHDQARRSSRQQQLIPMGGVIGSARLEDPRLPLLWPLLWLGQWCQLGKGTSMGLGDYRLEAV